MFKFQFIKKLFFGKKALDGALLEEIETMLLTADVGVSATQQLIATLTQKLVRKELNDADAAFKSLQDEMKSILQANDTPLVLPPTVKPFVILVIGVNGAGKTTTIGKLAYYYQKLGKRVLLAAGDTFRAAAIEQLKVWGEKLNMPVIAQAQGSDSASVVFDALSAAKARDLDLMIADTAGRLHTQSPLLVELQKIRRVLAKIDPTAPHEVLLVLDAVFGQNALVQVKQFQEAIGVTGIVMTKLDGTAKGGSLFAIAKQTGLPIRFIGFGEKIEDLEPFNADQFVQRLFEG
ncbi:MAG: signal recognition particle-docking protein FtsY [Gammaproteobacteria bacterium RIFCSPHIGHO2_12_FULL_42_10]|nr:MAG: signal recognition particle-docking protein FtsY [Gammaproteobacteria bacterium RIFCSPHIGHO2_12_FULL_42_10]